MLSGTSPGVTTRGVEDGTRKDGRVLPPSGSKIEDRRLLPPSGSKIEDRRVLPPSEPKIEDGDKWGQH